MVTSGFVQVVEEPCKACGGKGTQTSTVDGLVHRCPACGGNGKWQPCYREQWPMPWPLTPQPMWWDNIWRYDPGPTCDDLQFGPAFHNQWKEVPCG